MMTEGKSSVVALVPMRHHSERVEGKNYRSLGGKPLYAHICETLLACPEVIQVVIDTDSAVIHEGVERLFPSIRLIQRPDHLIAGEIPINQILRHDIDIVDEPFYLQTHSTNPLLRTETISRAVKTFFENYPEHDSLFSVTRFNTRLWTPDGEPINHDPDVLLRTQDLPPIYEENSCLYIFEKSVFKQHGNRIGSRPYLFEIEPSEAWDIDEEYDFRIVDLLMRSQS